jgi:class 3 adenylate cyclase
MDQMRTSSIVTAAAPSGPDGWPVREERRTVTVLFADIVGSTALVEALDPEDVRALQRAYFDTVAGVLHRWHGVVEKYIGDAVVAVFGVPGSDEHDAYRAVRAGLQVQEALDDLPLTGAGPVRVRVGLATGEVVVDLAATHDGGHGAISGAVFTTAARLQGYAPAGAVVACAATQRATAGLVRYTDLPATVALGWTGPVGVRRVDGPVPPPATVRELAPLVGRERELSTVVERISGAARDRQPRWVSMVGPAGVGKTRLVQELGAVLRRVHGDRTHWFVGRCAPYPHTPLAPLADMVRTRARIPRGAPVELTRRRLATLVDDLLPDGPAGAVDTLAALVAAAERPAPGPAVAAGAQLWRRALLAAAARRPTVVVVDGLDRAPAELVRFLRALFTTAVARGLPLTVLVTHRPEWAEVIAAPARALRCTVPVPPLGPADTARLVRSLLATADRPPELAARVAALAGGNPGVAEEYTRLLAGLPVEPGPELPVPEAVRRTTSAALDRLDERRRAVVTAGSVLGAGMTVEALACLLGLDLHQAGAVVRELAAAGVFLRGPGGREYDFADPVLRQVAYARLPREARAELHRRATRWRAATATLHVRFSRRGGPQPAPPRRNVTPSWRTARPAPVTGGGTGQEAERRRVVPLPASRTG